MVCTDRQLVQSQLEQGFSTRIGVARAVRPLGGPPTLENLYDYMQRELVPGVRQLTSKLNEVYLPAKENASSANPLTYDFAESIAGGDPTTGFLKVNATPQNTATIIRASQTNKKLSDVATWFSVMQGGSTAPLGVVTLSDAADPGRFIRFNLTSMTDQGAYWDLGVTVVESSHPNPFVQGESVLVSYIAGVASGGVTLASSIAAIRGVSAGTQLLTSGTLVFSNSNNVAFGLSNSSILTAQAIMSVAGGTNGFAGASALSFINGGGVSWARLGAAGTASIFATAFINASHVGGNSVSATGLAFSNASGVTWSLSTAASGATVLASVNDQSLAVVSHVGGNVQSSVTRLAFSNASGATWSLSTAAGAATVLLSVNDQSLAVVSHVGGNVQSSVTRLAFSNASGVTWSASTAAGAVTMLASVNDQSIGLLSHVGGNQVSSATRLAFSNGSGVSFGLSTAAGGATLTASVANESQTFIGGIAGGTQTATSGTIVFSNSNDFTFGLSGSTRMTASYLPQIGLVSHIGGNVVSSVTRLAFSNDSNVTWSLSTAANAATVIASVAAGGAGGLGGIAANGSTITSGTLLFARPNTGLTAGASLMSQENVFFDWQTGASSTRMLATALIRVTANITTTGGFAATKINFVNSNGVTWGVDTSNDNDGRGVEVTAKLADLTWWCNSPDLQQVGVNASNFGSSMIVFPLGAGGFPGNMTLGTCEIFLNGGQFSTTQCTNQWGVSFRGAIYTLANSTQLSLVNSFSSAVSSTTIASSASATRNNLYAGSRWLSIATSQWSSSPVLSAGVQYWMGLLFSITGASVAFDGWNMVSVGNPASYRGFMGVNQSTMLVRGLIPFLGTVSTGAIPSTIGTAGLISGPPGGFGFYRPLVQFRNGINLGAA